jgi:hypothetical protein
MLAHYHVDIKALRVPFGGRAIPLWTVSGLSGVCELRQETGG